MAHHRGRAKTAINESSAFEDAIQRTLAMTDEKNTLIIVTADHTHTLSINGYQERGADLFGKFEKFVNRKCLKLLFLGYFNLHDI